MADIDTTVYKMGRNTRRKMLVLSNAEHLIEDYTISGFLLHNSSRNYIIKVVKTLGTTPCREKAA